MQYARIENGQCNTNLPSTGTLKNGCTVSGYDKLSQEELLAEGWKELVDEIPTYDEETQYTQFSEYIENATTVTRKYVVVDKPVEQPQEYPVNNELADAYEAIAMLNERLLALEGN